MRLKVGVRVRVRLGLARLITGVATAGWARVSSSRCEPSAATAGALLAWVRVGVRVGVGVGVGVGFRVGV